MTLMAEQQTHLPDSSAQSRSATGGDELKQSSEHLPLNQLYKAPKTKPVFNYDPEMFSLCVTYLKEKNHHGLALLARQKGIPPFLRFKVWPVLLKHHPFVLNPFLQPDNIEDERKKGGMGIAATATATATSTTATAATTTIITTIIIIILETLKADLLALKVTKMYFLTNFKQQFQKI